MNNERGSRSKLLDYNFQFKMKDLSPKMQELKFSFASSDAVCNNLHSVQNHALDNSDTSFTQDRINITSFKC